MSILWTGEQQRLFQKDVEFFFKNLETLYPACRSELGENNRNHETNQEK